MTGIQSQVLARSITRSFSKSLGSEGMQKSQIARRSSVGRFGNRWKVEYGGGDGVGGVGSWESMVS